MFRELIFGYRGILSLKGKDLQIKTVCGRYLAKKYHLLFDQGKTLLLHKSKKFEDIFSLHEQLQSSGLFGCRFFKLPKKDIFILRKLQEKVMEKHLFCIT